MVVRYTADYQLKASTLSGLSAEYIAVLTQLRTLQSPIVNYMLREVDGHDSLPNIAKKKLLLGYRSEAAVTTTNYSKAVWRISRRFAAVRPMHLRFNMPADGPS